MAPGPMATILATAEGDGLQASGRIHQLDQVERLMASSGRAAKQ